MSGDEIGQTTDGAEQSWKALMGVEEGDHITVQIEDFDNTLHPRDENPRTIEGTIENVGEDVGYAAGEVQRVVTVGDPWSSGCNIDVADTSENNLVSGGPRGRKYLKAWRPRAGKDSRLLGRVRSVEAETEQSQEADSQ